MNLNQFLEKLNTSPETVDFKETMSVVESEYIFTETAFKNGDTYNEAGQNSGSCKLFALAQHNKLDKEATLACFGDYYRKDVLENPKATDHANIRNFMKYGWEGIQFEGTPLTAK